MSKLPLAGIRVADFGWIINGPLTTSWLAAMGAEVIKVESNVYPDIIRRMPVYAPNMIPGLERSGEYHYLNFNKKACLLNLATPKGRELAYRLVSISDIAMECHVAPVARKLGLTYEAFKAAKPDIILISMSLFGKWGPISHWMGWGPITCGFGGLSHLTGYPGGEPRGIAAAWPDHEVAPAAVFQILAALHHRDKTGEGQWIDYSMGEIVQSMIPEFFMDYAMNRRDPGPMGNRHPSMAPHGTYPCQGDDKWVAIAVETEKEWQGLCQAMGNPAWTQEERFSSRFHRLQNREELDRLIGEWTKNHTHYEAATILQKVGVAAAPCLNGYELLEDPHLGERGMWVEMDHGEVGRRRGPGLPLKMSAVDIPYSRAPFLGEHNEEVFRGLLGLSGEEYERLKEEKVIY